MKNIFKQLKAREWGFIGMSAALIVFQVWLDLKLPDYMKEITTLIQTPGSAMAEIWKAGGWMLLCALGSGAMAVTVGFFSAQVAATLAMRLREGLFSKVNSFSVEEINRFSTASLITRSTNDITQIQMMVAMGLQVMVKAPVLAIWAITKILGKSWQWSVLTAVAVLILLIAIGVVVAIAMPRFKKIQVLTDNINRVMRENLTGIRVVRAYNAEEYQINKFAEANDDLTKNNLVAFRVMALLAPVMSMVMNGLSLGIYWIGAVLINNAVIDMKIDLFGDMVVFSSYAMQVIMAFIMLSMIFMMLPRVAVSIRRVSEVLSVTPIINDPENPVCPTDNKGEVEFRSVSFRYPDAEEYVLKDISFKAKRGDTVAFIGSTGSGKSTLINLIPRFYDATEGAVLIDGVDVKDYSQRDLRNKLGYVPQRGVLFSGTVESNVNFGENPAQPDENDILAALETAQAADFVEKMDGQLKASIAQGGTNVSGGQKQRLSIARAVARNPEIYIFDDSFSALDYKTDKVLRSALRKHTADATSLIVAQRIGTVKDADLIVVLDHGRAVGVGTHKELLSSCEVYKEIAYSQLSKEELENA